MQQAATEGFDRLVRHLTPEHLIASGTRQGFEAASLAIENEAKMRAPVDRGTLRQSITHQVDSAAVPLWAEIGSALFYAPFMEYGTGLVHDHPSWPRVRHSPPAGALEVWAGRHGVQHDGFFTPGQQIAYIIRKRGGLRPRRYLRGAVAARRDAVQILLNNIAEAMRRSWGAP